ncbi:MAG: hypothetical protein GY898_05970 [Proteobacteria bacterium]|nr:hypothetical protein [Pseudomonadota bacterium]
MVWIDLPEPDDKLMRGLKRWISSDGNLPEVVSCMLVAPKALQAVMQANMAVSFGGSTLGRRREELIATSVSALNDCFY